MDTDYESRVESPNDNKVAANGVSAEDKKYLDFPCGGENSLFCKPRRFIDVTLKHKSYYCDTSEQNPPYFSSDICLLELADSLQAGPPVVWGFTACPEAVYYTSCEPFLNFLKSEKGIQVSISFFTSREEFLGQPFPQKMMLIE